MLALAVPFVGFGPAVGAGFARDDFRWLWHARLSGVEDLARLLTEHLGFYRPVTSLAWAADLLRNGPDPTAFGLTNLLFHVVTLVLFGLVALRLSVPVAAGTSHGPGSEPGHGDREGPGRGRAAPEAGGEAAIRGAAALVAVLLAAMSHHYSRTAVLWVSGRGALLGALFGTAAVLSWETWLRDRGGLGRCLGACALAGLAAFSYEGAVGATGLLAAMVFLRGRAPRGRADRGEWGWALLPLWVLGLYLVVRSGLGAMQPWAPESGYGYRAGAVLPNLAEYVARAAVPGLILLILLLLVAAGCGAARRVVRACGEGAVVVLPVGLAWFLLGVLPALPVPRRSDLYVHFAALGVHLVAGTAVGRGFLELEAAPGTRRRARIGTAAVIALVMVAWVPWAWGRNARLAEPARLAMATVDELRDASVEPLEGDCWIFRDRRELDPDLHDAFSDHLPWVVGFVRRGPPEPGSWWAGEASELQPESCRRIIRVRLAGAGEEGAPSLEVEIDDPAAAEVGEPAEDGEGRPEAEGEESPEAGGRERPDV